MKNDFLLRGDGSGGVPQLIFTEEAAVNQIAHRFDLPDTLVVCSPFYESALRAQLAQAQIVVAEFPSVENVETIFKRDGFSEIRTVVGIGGGVSTDMAKAVGVKKNLYVYPTILSTNCLSNNRSVLGSGLGSFSYPSGNPKETVISMHELMSQSAELRAYWTQAGFGDFVAELSAAIESELKNKGNVCDPNAVIARDPEVWQGIQWISQLDPQEIYQAPFMKRFAELLHSTSAKILEAGSNAHRIGSEHDLYKALLTIDPQLRFRGAPHGTITGLGTLLVTKVYAEQTGHSLFYTELRKSFAKMGIALTYPALEKIGLTRDKIVEALQLVKADPDADRYLREYVDQHGYDILDRVFGETG